MKTYKCNKHNCGNTWQSSIPPFECPSCHEIDFSEEGGNGFFEWIQKKWFIPVGVILLVLLLILLKNCGGGVKINPKSDKEKCKLEVTIKGGNPADFEIQLNQDGITKRKQKGNATFSGLEGTYTLNVKYIGKGNCPQIGKYKRTFTFAKPEKSYITVTPFISAIELSPKVLTKKVSTCTVIVIVDTNLIPSDNVEFSMNGEQWQNSNEFYKVGPGKYNFYARNVDNTDLVSSMEREIDKPIVKMPTAAEINPLLRRISNGDASACNALYDMVGSATTVTGLGSDITDVLGMVTEAIVNHVVFTVKTVNISGDHITSLSVYRG